MDPIFTFRDSIFWIETFDSVGGASSVAQPSGAHDSRQGVEVIAQVLGRQRPRRVEPCECQIHAQNNIAANIVDAQAWMEGDTRFCCGSDQVLLYRFHVLAQLNKRYYFSE